MTQIMGVLNVTPDSFSDGGRFLGVEKALRHAEKLHKEGADIIDIGGESTRPGAVSVSIDEELSRTVPVIEAIKNRLDIRISIDTSKPEVMRSAVAAGADMINDIYALRAEGALSTAQKLGVDICLMHMQGSPQNMQQNPRYQNVVTEIIDFFKSRVAACENLGIRREKIILDPGFGFGKNLAHNIEIFKNLRKFKIFNLPLLVGLSRKSMIGALLGQRPVDERKIGSVAAAVLAVANGANIVRVHDVAETRDALSIWHGIYQNRQ